MTKETQKSTTITAKAKIPKAEFQGMMNSWDFELLVVYGTKPFYTIEEAKEVVAKAKNKGVKV